MSLSMHALIANLFEAMEYLYFSDDIPRFWTVRFPRRAEIRIIFAQKFRIIFAVCICSFVENDRKSDFERHHRVPHHRRCLNVAGPGVLPMP